MSRTEAVLLAVLLAVLAPLWLPPAIVISVAAMAVGQVIDLLDGHPR